MKYKESIAVVCPFYQGEEKQKLHCEGVESGCKIHLAFATPQQRNAYRKRNCVKDHKGCSIAQMLYRKWEEMDG